MSEKLCVFCKHFDWTKAEETGYCETCRGFDEGGASCSKRHFYKQNPEDADDMRKLYLTAETCPDYAPPGASPSPVRQEE